MALCGVGWSPGLESVETGYLRNNLSTRLIRRNIVGSSNKASRCCQRQCRRVQCAASNTAVSPMESEENAQDRLSLSADAEFGHAMKFKMSDFSVSDIVSVGLGGRADEVLFEAIVKDPHSPLYNKRVVLRRLTSDQAKRRGKRAIEVLKKLARRSLMYHSYSLQVHGYVSSPSDLGSFTLVHGYHGSFSLRHWFRQTDWLPTLEATLALDEESVRKVGDDTVGGPAVSRQLRLTRILMRDLLIGVNYLHSHGLAHTELRLENVHISPVDRHIKVGILGNAVDFYDNNPNSSSLDRRQMMIAFDMRCVGFMMAKMVMQELMDPLIFAKLKSFLMKGYDPSCLREYLLRSLGMNSSSGSAGLQILDRNSGAGWHLLSLLLANKPMKRISCLDALRHPFLCGPRWRIKPSMDFIRWGLGSTAVRITEEYIYGQPQRKRLAHFIELMEKLNSHSRPRNWLEFLPGKWRLLYSTGRHIGLTLRQPSVRVLIGDVHLNVSRASTKNTNLYFTSDIGFTVLIGDDWPHDKSGTAGQMQINSSFKLMAGRRLYLNDENTEKPSKPKDSSPVKKISNKRWKKAFPLKEFPTSLPVAKLVSSECEVRMKLGDPLSADIDSARSVVQELRTQVPPELFDVSRLVCGTYVDARLMVLRGVNGQAHLFTRYCENAKCT